MKARAALAAGIAPGMVLMDVGYGADTRLRTEITALGLRYVAGILPNTTVWPQGRGPLPPKPWSGRDRPTSRMGCDDAHRPVPVKALALALPEDAWQTVTPETGSLLRDSPHALPGRGCARRIVTSSAPDRETRNGY
jgi:SRSO17 transposase